MREPERRVSVAMREPERRRRSTSVRNGLGRGEALERAHRAHQIGPDGALDRNARKSPLPTTRRPE
jgi:hypothetical protein